MKRILAGISVSLALFTGALISQSPTSSISGTISDPTGAVISNAAIELKSISTGAVWSATSSQTGTYTIASLTVGSYELTVNVPGFKKYVRTLTLTQNERRRADIVLEIGAATESVTVTDSAPLLRTESGMVAGAAKGGGKGGGGGMRINGAPGAAFAPQIHIGLDIDIRRDRIRPGTPNTEEYGHYVENEFTSPQQDPLSTFSVDVDTASYSNARRFINDRQLPPPESVRIEELINYFSYDYPLPDKGKPVSMTTHLMRNPWNSNRLLLHVGLRTTPIAAEDLPPSNLTFLVDVSGSMMSPDKLPLVRQALQMLVRQLRAQDSVSLVVYAGNAGVVLPPTHGNNQQQILDAIGRLEAGGSTHGSAGIRLAYKMARESFSKSSNNRVILATDGDFNVGVQSDDELIRLIEDERKSGVFLSVLGFGTGNLKDAKMEKLADHGNGTYAYIDSLAEARKVFVHEMGASLVTVAKDVKLQIEFNPARVKEYRLIGYENRILRPEDFNDDAKDAGDLGAGHQVTAFYEIIPTGSTERGGTDPLRYQNREKQTAPAPNGTNRTNELAWLKLRHKAPQGDRSELLEWPVSASVADFRAVPRDVRFAAAVTEYGLLLRHSKFLGDASFEHVIATANDSLGPDLAGYRADFLDLARRAAYLSDSHVSRR
jgi:Ca-activated chloride channel family protein